MTGRTPCVGVWFEWPPGVALQGEGVWSLLCQIIAHMPPGQVRFVFFVPPWFEAAATSLRDNLPAAIRPAIRIETARTSEARLRRRAVRAWRRGRGHRIGDLVPLRWLRGAVDRRYRRTRRTAIEQLQQVEALEFMIRDANALDEIDVWLVPFSHFARSARLYRPKLCVFHDFLFDEFPPDVPREAIDAVRNEFRRVIAAADCCVTLSEHVRQRHAIAALEARPERTFTIPLAPIDRRHVLDFVPGDFSRTAESRRRAADLLRAHCASMPSPNPRHAALTAPYLRDFPFEDVDYIVVSSQIRAHKRILMVVEAVERLIRREHRPVKLILTGTFNLDDPQEEVGRYVAQRALHFDVLSLPRLPVAIHTALLHAAALTVHPSPFEASFPFPFGESVSVGTPVVLARSAVVAAALDGTRHAAMAYDPSSPDALHAAIVRALDDRAAALAPQVELFQERARRQWTDVSADYLALLTATANSRPRADSESG